MPAYIFCNMGLFAGKISTSPKKNGGGTKYENKEKENNSTHENGVVANAENTLNRVVK
jgi:hypothetical protein